MRWDSDLVIKIAAVMLLVVSLVVLTTGGDALAGVGQYGRHGN